MLEATRVRIEDGLIETLEFGVDNRFHRPGASGWVAPVAAAGIAGVLGYGLARVMR